MILEDLNMRYQPVTPRRWPLLVGIVFAIAGVVAAATIYFASRSDGQAPSAPVATPATGRVTGQPTTLADGCLGGSDPSRAILIAFEQAPLTPEGAAAFAATYMRWGGQIPHGADDARTVGTKVWAPEIPKYMTQLDRLPRETVAWVSTSEARYRVDSVTGSAVTIALLVQGTQISNGATASEWMVGRFDLRALDGHWRMAGGTPLPAAAVDDLRREGIPFRGGC